MSNSAGASPLVMVTAGAPSQNMPRLGGTAVPSTVTPLPAKKYSERRAPAGPAGNVSVAPGLIATVQIATPLVGSDAHDAGGGGGDSGSPATSTSSLVRPAASVIVRRGIVSPHSIVKCGVAIFDLRGKLSQIWNSSTGLS